jgi:hypothetical protein
MRPAVNGLVYAVALGVALAGCAGLTPVQEAGWTAFHACQPVASTAAIEDLQQGGRVNYRTHEGVEFGAMKACMESRGYRCDLGVTVGSRPQTHCYPRTT